jgi:murein DD-endopeptidase MepM/ murein hydrolase activator NlpD
MRLQQPWPADRSINKASPYGWRVHPISHKKAFHRGVDVSGSFPVTAAGDGVVGHVGFSRTGGGHVVGIDHGAVWTFYYHGAHATKLRKGQRVEAGDAIYTSGSTGASTGAHLHFETRVSKTWGTTADPLLYLSDGLLWLLTGYLAGSIRLLGCNGRQLCVNMGTRGALMVFLAR